MRLIKVRESSRRQSKLESPDTKGTDRSKLRTDLTSRKQSNVPTLIMPIEMELIQHLIPS